MTRTLLISGVTALAAATGMPALAGGLPVSGALTLWLAADAAVTASPGGSVSSWQDLSGAGNDATQASGGNQPTWVPNQLNGLPVVRFTTGRFMALAGNAITNQAFTVVAVVRDLRSDGNFREIVSNWNNSNGNMGTSVFFGTTGLNPVRMRLSDDYGGAAQGQTGVGEVANPAAFTILSGISGAAGAALYQGSTAVASRPTPLAGRNLAGPWVIGRQGNGTFDEYWNGDIAELVIFSRELSAGELSTLWSHLSEKYGIHPPRLAIVPAGAGAALQFTMAPPYAFHLQVSDSLSAPAWSDLVLYPAVAAATNVSAVISLDRPQRYFRLQVGP